jgi:hypothetical protein
VAGDTADRRGVTGCFYRRLDAHGDDEVLESTDATRSNWDREIQHGSPPLAVLTKAIETMAAGSGQRIGRMTLDILGAIPVATVHVRAWVDRPGRRIAVYVAEMLAERAGSEARPVARVTAWLLATSETGDVASDRYPPLVEGPTDPLAEMFTGLGGYLHRTNLRPQQTTLGEARVYWVRPMVNVLDGEPDSALIKLASVVDTANGVGSILDHRRFVYMNTDTVVHLHRLPTGEDFAIRARASIGPDGIGVTTAELFDRIGFIGTCAQMLLVQRRP